MPADTVLGLWRVLTKRDWDSVKTFLSDHCLYTDMPVGPTLAARGPDDIVKRLKVGLEPSPNTGIGTPCSSATAPT
jgi:hypothetical protein